MGNLSCENFTLLTFNKIQVMPYIPEQCFTVTWPVTHWCTTTVSAWLGYRSGDQNPWSCNDWEGTLLKTRFFATKNSNSLSHNCPTQLFFICLTHLSHNYPTHSNAPITYPHCIIASHLICVQNISTHRNINVPVGVGAPPPLDT